MTPRIVTYTSTDPDAPPHMRAAAAMVPTVPGTHWITTAATPEQARAKCQATWDAQSATVRGVVKTKKRPKPAPAADIGDVI